MKIALLGDIALFGKYSISNNHIYDYLADVAERLKEFDLVVGNLETPLCDDCKKHGHKSAHIKAEEANIDILRFLNVNVVNLANNHIYDYGREGYKKTIEILNKNGIKHFGVDNSQLRLEINNNKIAFAGYCCYSTNGLNYYNQKTKKGVNVLDAFQVEKDLLNNHSEGYFNIASFHVGQEHVNLPNYDHVEMARILAEKVPYVFYGHHPHVIQGIEEVNNSLIAYSLGNFCFDDVYTHKSAEPLIRQSEENRKSFIISLEIKDSKKTNHEIITISGDANKMHINPNKELNNMINQYSEYLEKEKDIFIDLRGKLLGKYLIDRRAIRDINWYVKRINVNSVIILYKAIVNKKKYNKNVIKYIQARG